MTLVQILLLVFFLSEFVLGIPDGVILYLNRYSEDYELCKKRNLISNIIFFIMIAVAIAGCVLLQIYGKLWWSIFPLFFTGLFTVYIVYGLIKGIKRK